MRKSFILFSLIFLLIGLAFVDIAQCAQLYNPYEKRWETVPDQSSVQEHPENKRQLKYNPYEREWEYIRPDAQLEYNPYEKKWEFER